MAGDPFSVHLEPPSIAPLPSAPTERAKWLTEHAVGAPKPLCAWLVVWGTSAVLLGSIPPSGLLFQPQSPLHEPDVDACARRHIATPARATVSSGNGLLCAEQQQQQRTWGAFPWLPRLCGGGGKGGVWSLVSPSLCTRSGSGSLPHAACTFTRGCTFGGGGIPSLVRHRLTQGWVRGGNFVPTVDCRIVFKCDNAIGVCRMVLYTLCGTLCPPPHPHPHSTALDTRCTARCPTSLHAKSPPPCPTALDTSGIATQASFPHPTPAFPTALDGRLLLELITMILLAECPLHSSFLPPRKGAVPVTQIRDGD